MGRRLKFDREKEPKTYDKAYYEMNKKHYERALPAFIEFLKTNFNFKSICDVGCGTGAFVKPLEKDYDVLGIDFSVGFKKLCKLKKSLNFDMTIPLYLGREFDIVLCLETFEHIPEEFENVFLKNIFGLNPKFIIMGCAEPRQWGRHHYNPKGKKYIMQKMIEAGYKVDNMLTDKFSKIKYFATFYRRNTVVFVRDDL